MLIECCVSLGQLVKREFEYQSKALHALLCLIAGANLDGMSVRGCVTGVAVRGMVSVFCDVSCCGIECRVVAAGFGGFPGRCVSECQAKQIVVGIDMYPYAVVHNSDVAACRNLLSWHSLHQHTDAKLCFITSSVDSWCHSL